MRCPYCETINEPKKTHCIDCGRKISTKEEHADMPPIDWLHAPVSEWRARYEALEKKHTELVELLCNQCFDNYRMIA